MRLNLMLATGVARRCDSDPVALPGKVATVLPVPSAPGRGLESFQRFG
jgi:hypothetical protein